MPCEPLSMLGGFGRTADPSGPPRFDNGAHGTEKLLLKVQVSEDFA